MINLLNMKNDQKSKNILLFMRIAVFLTFIYKSWLTAELEYNTLGGVMSMGVFGRIGAYIITGGFMFLLYFFASSLSFGSLYRSKYSPVDADGERLFTKTGFNMIFAIAVSVSNIIAGSLNFIAFGYRVATTFIIIVLPFLMSVLTIVGTFLGMLACVGKRNGKNLLVSMCFPAIIMLLLLR